MQRGELVDDEDPDLDMVLTHSINVDLHTKGASKQWIEETVIGPDEGLIFRNWDSACYENSMFHIKVKFTTKLTQKEALDLVKPQEPEINPVKSKLQELAKFEVIDRDGLGHLTDVEIKTKDSRIPCHSFLLSQKSDVFATMLRLETKESEAKSIAIDDFESDTVDNLIKYLYGQQLQESNFDTELLRIADKYNISRLKLECEFHLVNQLSNENVADIWIHSHRCQAENLRESTINFLKKNWSSNDKMPNLKEIMVENPELIEDIFQFIELRN